MSLSSWKTNMDGKANLAPKRASSGMDVAGYGCAGPILLAVAGWGWGMWGGVGVGKTNTSHLFRRVNENTSWTAPWTTSHPEMRQTALNTGGLMYNNSELLPPKI